jgi:hypothetical protein
MNTVSILILVIGREFLLEYDFLDIWLYLYGKFQEFIYYDVHVLVLHNYTGLFTFASGLSFHILEIKGPLPSPEI